MILLNNEPIAQKRQGPAPKETIEFLKKHLAPLKEYIQERTQEQDKRKEWTLE